MESRLGDDRPPIGVTDEYRVAVDLVEGLTHPGRVGVQVAERTPVLAMPGQIERTTGNSGRREQGEHSFPCPGTVPRAMDQDDRPCHVSKLSELDHLFRVPLRRTTGRRGVLADRTR